MLKNVYNLLKIGSNTALRPPRIDQHRPIKRWVAPTLRELQRRREKRGPAGPEPRSGHLEWNYDAELFAFGARLGENFEGGALRAALTHRSYAGAEDAGPPDNREMIRTGGDIVRDCLTREFGLRDYPEAVVRTLRGYLTTEEVLAHVASHIGLKDIVLCSDFPVERKTLADTFCAVVAALETSSGMEVTEKFIKDFLITQLTGKELFDVWKLEDSYEYLRAALKGKSIEARLCNQSGVNTILSNYQIGLYSEKKLLGTGFGETIDVAKNMAALDVLNKMYMKRKVSLA